MEKLVRQGGTGTISISPKNFVWRNYSFQGQVTSLQYNILSLFFLQRTTISIYLLGYWTVSHTHNGGLQIATEYVKMRGE